LIDLKRSAQSQKVKSGMKTDAERLGAGKPRVSPAADTERWLDSSLLDFKSSLSAPDWKQHLAWRMPNKRTVLYAVGTLLAWALVLGICWLIFALVHLIFG
jgi:hypothetical protein